MANVGTQEQMDGGKVISIVTKQSLTEVTKLQPAESVTTGGNLLGKMIDRLDTKLKEAQKPSYSCQFSDILIKRIQFELQKRGKTENLELNAQNIHLTLSHLVEEYLKQSGTKLAKDNATSLEWTLFDFLLSESNNIPLSSKVRTDYIADIIDQMKLPDRQSFVEAARSCVGTCLETFLPIPKNGNNFTPLASGK